MQLTETCFPRKAAAPSWITASSFGESQATASTDLSALGEHFHLCRRISGSFFQIQCWADSAHAFVAGRFVTTVAACATLIGIAILIA